jgi:hypothetical protein
MRSRRPLLAIPLLALVAPLLRASDATPPGTVSVKRLKWSWPVMSKVVSQQKPLTLITANWHCHEGSAVHTSTQ